MNETETKVHPSGIEIINRFSLVILYSISWIYDTESIRIYYASYAQSEFCPKNWIIT